MNRTIEYGVAIQPAQLLPSPYGADLPIAGLSVGASTDLLVETATGTDACRSRAKIASVVRNQASCLGYKFAARIMRNDD